MELFSLLEGAHSNIPMRQVQLDDISEIGIFFTANAGFIKEAWTFAALMNMPACCDKQAIGAVIIFRLDHAGISYA